MNFVDFVFNLYSRITSHVSQAFASYTHYTSYSLLNFVHVIVCVFYLSNQVWKFLDFYAKHIWCLRFSENGLKILIFGKTRFKTYVFEKAFHLILMHVIHKFQCFMEFLHYFALFFKKLIFPEFRPIEIATKNVCKSLSVSIGARLVLDQLKHFRPIESNFWWVENRIESFFKNWVSHVFIHFFKTSFSLYSIGLRL